MKNLLEIMDKKVNNTFWTLIINGIFLLLLGVLIVWTDFVLRLVIGLIVILLAYVLFYMAFRIKNLKKEVDKHFKIFK